MWFSPLACLVYLWVLSECDVLFCDILPCLVGSVGYIYIFLKQLKVASVSCLA
jgi:hypothetical protein